MTATPVTGSRPTSTRGSADAHVPEGASIPTRLASIFQPAVSPLLPTSLNSGPAAGFRLPDRSSGPRIVKPRQPTNYTPQRMLGLELLIGAGMQLFGAPRTAICRSENHPLRQGRPREYAGHARANGSVHLPAGLRPVPKAAARHDVRRWMGPGAGARPCNAWTCSGRLRRRGPRFHRAPHRLHRTPDAGWRSSP